MKKLLVVLAVAALAAPALADYDLLRTSATPSGVTTIQGDPRNDDNLVYANTDLNGYYTAFAFDDYWKGELCVTIATAPWQMNAFHFGVYLNGDGAETFNVDFFLDDGYYPWTGSWITGYTLDLTGYSGGVYGQVDVDPVVMPTQAVWMVYTMNSADGVLHVDPPAEIGADYFSDGWIESDGLGYHWWWYGGYPANPGADLYCAMNAVPEPATLALVALGFVLLRRR